MSFRASPLAGLFTALLVLSAGRSEAAMVDIGTLGGANSVAWAVNASGQFVGRSYTGSEHHAYSYSGGVMTDLGTLPGTMGVMWNSEAFGINDSGQIVGGSLAIDPGTMLTTTHAFLYSGGVMTDLGTGGAFESEAHDINNNGDVVGLLNGLPGNLAHAFLYSGGVMTDLGVLPGVPAARVSNALAINDSGQIVGRAATISYDYHAFLYSSGVMTDLGTLGGATSEAVAINNAGQIVGHSTIAGGFTRAFLYEGGVMTSLGTLGGNNSWATGIDSYGQIVGYSNTVAGPVHAFLFRDGLMHDLGHMGGDISQAYAIGDGGRVVGTAYTAGGQEHGFYYDLCSHDGVLDIFEQCDDGNPTDGDGCDSSCQIEQCYACTGEPSVCSPLPDGTACDDGLFCTGVDTCDASGICQNAGDPCPGGQCATCDEVNDRCFDPFGAPCTLGGVCGVAICSGSGSCDLVSKCEGPYGASSCSDTTDNDADSFVDALDADCQPLHEGPPGDPTCTNGTDDDSDGQVDGLDRGCLANPPEVCNGFDDNADATTDEGFPDYDADGIADCIDQDKDNDGVADKLDNCPLASNAAQTDTDFDGSGDACDNNVPAVINTPSTSAITVDGQFEPGSGEWADVTPVSYMGGDALVYTTLDPSRDAIYVMIDFSLSTARLAIGDEVGPISFDLGVDGIVDVFVRQGGADSDATAHPVSSTGGSGDSLRILLNGIPQDVTSGCLNAAVDFNTTSPNFNSGHNVVELSVRLFGHPGGCYSPGPSFWSVTLPGVVPSAAPLRAARASGSSSSLVIAQSYVELDEDSGATTLAPIGADSPPIDAFQCYSASDLKDPKFVPSTIALTDEFETKSTTLVKPMTVCPPTQVSDPIIDSTASLACYKIKDAPGQTKFVPKRVQMTDSIGTLQLEASKAAELCVPTRLNGEASTLSIENFKCYKAKDLKNPKFGGGAALLSNRFASSGTVSSAIMNPVRVCNPASTGSPVVNQAAHLLCYKVKDFSGFAGAEVTTQNALGGLRLKVKKATMLCMPSTLVVLP